MSLTIPGQLLIFHAPEPITPLVAERLKLAFETVRRTHAPLVLDPGWRIEQVPIRERKRIRLAHTERWLTA